MLAQEKVGIIEGTDSDGDRCYWGWGTDLFNQSVHWTHSTSETGLCATRQEAIDELVNDHEREIRRAKATIDELSKTVKNLERSKKAVKAGRPALILVALAIHRAEQRAKERLDKEDQVEYASRALREAKRNARMPR